MERTDWLDGGFGPAVARFLMVTAITHHRFSSQLWGETEVLKLYAELTEIELAVMREIGATRPGRCGQPGPWAPGAGPVLAHAKER